MWIEAHQTLNNHPKLKRAARLAGIEQVAMIGYLLRLWWWCLDYAEDGDISAFAIEDIEDAVDWNGEPGKLYHAWQESGFIDTAVVHDWNEYAGRLIEKRRMDAARKRTIRRTSNGHPADIAAPSAEHPPDGAGNRTEPNLTNTTSIERETDKPPVVVVGQSSDPFRLICATWEQRMGQTITPALGQNIREAMRSYGVATICDAIELSAEKGKPRWGYVSGILENWQREGRKNGAAKTKANGDGRAPLMQNDPNATGVTVTVIEL